jgi:hypothetical protein
MLNHRYAVAALERSLLAFEGAFMRGEARERWVQLCEQAAVEQDHDRLLKLIREISALLDEKEARLQAAQSGKQKRLSLKTDGSTHKLD